MEVPVVVLRRNLEDLPDAFRGKSFCSRSLIERFALMKEQKLGTIAEGEVKVMEYKEYGLVLRTVDIPEKTENFELVIDIEVGEWFIEEHYRGLLYEGTSYHDALQFSPTHLGRFMKPQMIGRGKPHSFGNEVPVLLGFVLEMMLVRVATHENSLKSGKFKVRLRLLPHEGELAGKLAGIVLRQGPAMKADGAFRGRQEPGYEPEKGGLATSIGSHDGVEIPLPEPEVKILEYRTGTIAEREILELYHGCKLYGVALSKTSPCQ